MTKTVDIAIVGLGAMGSAVAYHAARRGLSVVGFDLATPPHNLGSTHGESRIIREAYFENAFYVPIIQRSYDLWSELQETSDKRLLYTTGGLWIGPRDGTLIGGTRLSADLHNIDYELLSAKQIRKHYPALQPVDQLSGIFEPHAGILLPESCVEVHLALAQKHGADLHFDEPVTQWKPQGDGVRIKTQTDGDYHASQLVLATGAWTGQFLPDLPLPLTVERQVLYWFRPSEDPDQFTLDRLPIFAWEFMKDKLYYGFPNLGAGVKVALHHQGVFTDMDTLDREISPDEEEGIRLIVESTIPSLAGPLVKSEVCVYTNTPDEHFVIDFHPDLRQVLIISACSGHGFKFSAVIGEIATDLLTGTKPAFDLSPFRVGRLLEGKP